MGISTTAIVIGVSVYIVLFTLAMLFMRGCAVVNRNYDRDLDIQE